MQNAACPNSIRSHARDVTLLFADLRQFTELATSLESIPLVCELIGHVMDCLTEAVSRHQGCVVDYYGDGLFAMWNAPTNQPEHASLACSAALAMLDTLPAVAEDWSPVIQTELRLGIGVHTGTVQVGNSGSTRQAKFGPRGPNVHLASRVEAASKSLGLPLVATRATVEQLSSRFAAHRVCRAQLPGLNEPIDLYAVDASAGDAGSTMAWQLYEKALGSFEEGRVQEAADILATTDDDARIPWRFLAAEVRRELGRQQRRRSTDQPASRAGGVIVLTEK